MGWQDIVRQVTEDTSPPRTDSDALRRIEQHLRSIDGGIRSLVWLATLAAIVAAGLVFVQVMDSAARPRPPAPALSSP